MEDSQKQIFSLNLICYLRCNGFVEESVGFNENTNKVYFIYENTEELNEAIETYKDRDTVVNLHDFISEFRQLKEEMYFYVKDFKSKR